jgi:catechol 2,3-dioxygenase-like lactoylglutathione lyase family enzyme
MPMAIKGKQSVGQLGVTLIVQDVAAAADFYRDVLGAEEVQRNFSFGPNKPPGSEALSAELKLAGAYLIVAKENAFTRVRCLSEPPNAARIVGTRMKTLNRRCQGRIHEKTGDYISAPLILFRHAGRVGLPIIGKRRLEIHSALNSKSSLTANRAAIATSKPS